MCYGRGGSLSTAQYWFQNAVFWVWCAVCKLGFSVWTGWCEVHSVEWNVHCIILSVQCVVYLCGATMPEILTEGHQVADKVSTLPRSYFKVAIQSPHSLSWNIIIRVWGGSRTPITHITYFVYSQLPNFMFCKTLFYSAVTVQCHNNVLPGRIVLNNMSRTNVSIY